MPHPAEAPPVEAVSFALPNGLRVVMYPDHTVPAVAVNLTFDLGAGQDPEDRKGIAHLFEHLVFQGTVSNPHLLFDEVHRRGGMVNGSTGLDTTDFYVVLPPEELPYGLFQVSECLGWMMPTVDEERIRSELGVVLNERKERYEAPALGPYLERTLAAVFPPGHPYHLPGIGTEESLRAITLEDVRTFFADWYTPAHATLVLAGDFDPRAARRQIRSYYRDIPAGSARVADVPPSPPSPDAWVEMRRPVANPRVFVVWNLPDAPGVQDELHLLTRGPLAAGQRSRLERTLVDPGYASLAYSFDLGVRGANMLWLAVEGAPSDDLHTLVSRVDAMFDEGVTASPLDAAELDLARATAGLETAEAWEDLAQRSRMLQEALRLGLPGDPRMRYAGVTDDALRARWRTLAESPHVVVAVVPEAP